MSDVITQVRALLEDIHNGDDAAAQRLMPIVYKELRRLAARYLRNERPGQSIQATELVHDAYIRLVGNNHIDWQNKSHFFAVAAISMRRILVDRARRRLAEKHGGEIEKIEFDEAVNWSPQKTKELVELDDALKRLEQISPRQSRVVELRFFGGLEMSEIAKLEGASIRTIQEEWKVARAWLHNEIARGI